VYENRPAICREYATRACDWHGDEYEYEQLFSEPEQIEQFARQYLARKRKRRAAAKKKAGRKSSVPKKRSAKRSSAKKVGIPLRLLKSA
jgi:hypothetical protein